MAYQILSIITKITLLITSLMHKNRPFGRLFLLAEDIRTISGLYSQQKSLTFISNFYNLTTIKFIIYELLWNTNPALSVCPYHL